MQIKVSLGMVAGNHAQILIVNTITSYFNQVLYVILYFYSTTLIVNTYFSDGDYKIKTIVNSHNENHFYLKKKRTLI